METADAAPAELVTADNKRYEAMIARDVNALECLLADELLYTHSTGNTDTKQQYLETIRSDYVEYRSSQVDELVFRQRGDVGMLMGRARIGATIGGVGRLRACSTGPFGVTGCGKRSCAQGDKDDWSVRRHEPGYAWSLDA